jgi:predicted secreted hydrolase
MRIDVLHSPKGPLLAAMAACLALVASSPAAEKPAAAEDWKTVETPHPFAFPRDHAAHEDYRIEWWYYTGNLQAKDGRRFGYELTFFRTGIVRRPENPSRWAVRDLYITHFAISDLASGKFHFFERLNRRGVGWAGAESDRYRAWNGDWEVRLAGDRHLLSAYEGGQRLELTLTPTRPPVLHGDRGLSQKGPSRGNASHYYSLTRMETAGTLAVGGQEFSVTGLSWMDHEFSSSFLEPGQQGWDWFALQLDDGRDLMIYQIRTQDGRPDAQSSGTLVRADGTSIGLRRADFSLAPGPRHKMPGSGAEYPIAWRLRVPGHDLDLNVEAAMPDQEMNTTASIGVPYWEGAVAIRGTASGKPVAGRGYLEMTGYAGKGLGGRRPE